MAAGFSVNETIQDFVKTQSMAAGVATFEEMRPASVSTAKSTIDAAASKSVAQPATQGDIMFDYATHLRPRTRLNRRTIPIALRPSSSQSPD
jgi:hypothetical protein